MIALRGRADVPAIHCQYTPAVAHRSGEQTVQHTAWCWCGAARGRACYRQTGAARLERDYQHLQGRLRPLRDFQPEPTAQVVCAGHGFVRNLTGGYYRPGIEAGDPAVPQPPLRLRAWEDLTAVLLAG